MSMTGLNRIPSTSIGLLSVYPSTLHKIIGLHSFKFNNQPRRNLSITTNTIIKNMISGESRSSKPFAFTNYDCIGFDLDNTLCKYKIGQMIKMEYEVLSTYLVETKKYSPKHLLRPIEPNLEFIMKGLILDLESGNILKIDSTGKIVTACHGTKRMTSADIEKYYGAKRHWLVTDAYVKDALVTWNGPLAQKMRSLLDYFDMPVALIFGRLVDTLDEQIGTKAAIKKYDLWPDILSGLIDMFEAKQFNLNQGGYFPEMKRHPELYINKCSDNTVQWLKNLKKQNKVLFLISGSHLDFASFVASNCLGEEWSSLFDLAIFQAKKPGFFTGNRKFLTAETQQIVPGNSLIKNRFYTEGNFSDLHNFLSSTSELASPRTLYVGDNLIQDIFAPAMHTPCDTVAICEELQAEEMFGFRNGHDDSEYLKSKIWGSYFKGDASGNRDSFWMDIMKHYSRICGPSIEFFASNPVDHQYHM